MTYITFQIVMSLTINNRLQKNWKKREKETKKKVL